MRALQAMGLSMSDAIRLLLLRVANEQRMPFTIQVPRPATIKAMKELEEGKGQRLDNAENLYRDLDIHMTDLPAIERLSNNSAEVNASIIWLHGLGADGGDFAPIVPQLGLPAAYAVRFVFPSAPSIPVTINQGMVMPSWYDIMELGDARRIDVAGLRASAVKVQALLQREIDRGVPSERILLAGFSQGGAVGFEAGLSCQYRIGGIIALSTYFPTAASVVVHPAQSGLPVLVCHGSMDPMLNESLGRDAAESLRRLGMIPEYHAYPMAHEVSLQEIDQIGQWIRAVLGN